MKKKTTCGDKSGGLSKSFDFDKLQHYAANVARIADRGLNALVCVALVLILIYGVFSLWDTLRIYDQADASDLLKYKPSADGTEESPGFEELCALNPDVVGWLTVDDTGIDYPVVQGRDNSEYVNKDVFGEFSLSGTLFLDFRNAPDFTDFYNLIYGHHMDVSVMFGELQYFLEEDYFSEHDSGTIYIKDAGAYDVDWFACVRTDAYDVGIYSHRPFDDDGREDGKSDPEFLDYIKSISVQYRETKREENDRILALSTCSDAETNARILLFGYMRKCA